MFANQKIIKNRNVIFMEDSMSGGNNLEMQIGRNDGPMVVVMDESIKSFSCHNGEEREEQVEDYLVANIYIIV